MAEMTIKRFGVFSVAKMYGLLMFVFGLIIGVIYGLIFIIMGASMASIAPREQATFAGLGPIAVGIFMMIGIPIFYGVLGFIGGIIGALIYNALAGVVGGVKFELEAVQQDYAPPPPPNQWAPAR
jgi:MFS family permease